MLKCPNFKVILLASLVRTYVKSNYRYYTTDTTNILNLIFSKLVLRD